MSMLSRFIRNAGGWYSKADIKDQLNGALKAYGNDVEAAIVKVLQKHLGTVVADGLIRKIAHELRLEFEKIVDKVL